MKQKKFYIGVALFVIFVWGTTFVSTKVLLQSLSPICIMFFRYLIAYVALFAIYPKLHPPESLRHELLCLCGALFGSTLYFLAENYALTFTQAANVSLLISAAPILTSVICHLFSADEKFSRGELYGFFCAMVGIFLVVCNGQLVLKISPMGDLLALAAALSWAIYCFVLRRNSSQYKPIYITRKIFFYSLATMLPFVLLDPAPFDPAVLLQPIVWGNLLFLGLVASALCYVLWHHVVNALGAVKANNFVYLNPVVTMAASALVLREQISALMLLGALLILLGVTLADGVLLHK